jgi:hypothetical protein
MSDSATEELIKIVSAESPTNALPSFGVGKGKGEEDRRCASEPLILGGFLSHHRRESVKLKIR